MKLLITNDDGVQSKQLNHLAGFLVEKGHEVTVVAPESEMSAVSHSITMHNPLRIRKRLSDGLYQCYSVSGTPVDCVKIALDIVLSNPPDMIISGVNKGLNLGTDIFYSGTVSAAMEGFFHGIPSIALSAPEIVKSDFASLLDFFYDRIFTFIAESGCKGLYNVNFPDSGTYETLKITELGSFKYVNVYKERTDPRGNVYYWLAGEPDQNTNRHTTDVYAVENGHVSLTPVQCDLTDYEGLSKLKKIFE